MAEFDDGLLDDEAALEAAEGVLRPLAESGALLRRVAVDAEPALAELGGEPRPRALIAVGPEARLLRAVLEPLCPVPFVAWPSSGLPAWVGPLDLVVVLGGLGVQPSSCVHEALRRGSRLVVVAPEESSLARQAASRATTILPVASSAPLPGAIVALDALHRLGLGTPVSSSVVADALDAVAVACSHTLDLAHNPAKALALELADAQPLVWGGSVLAARAARRIAEAVRAASARFALAADAGALLPILASARPRDPFADPFDDEEAGSRTTLVVVEDGLGDEVTDEDRHALEENARHGDVRITHLAQETGDPLERYATVLAKGHFAAAYLQIGLRRVRGGL